MTNKSIVYDRSMAINEVIGAVGRGDTIICPKCGSELLIALDPDSMSRWGVHRGIYCAANKEHLSILIEAKTSPGFWEQFRSER